MKIINNYSDLLILIRSNTIPPLELKFITQLFWEQVENKKETNVFNTSFNIIYFELGDNLQNLSLLSIPNSELGLMGLQFEKIEKRLWCYVMNLANHNTLLIFKEKNLDYDSQYYLETFSKYS